jgi:hypothetical protein
MPSITVRSVRKGNGISGTFRLIVGNARTPPLPYDIPSSGIRNALLGLEPVGEDIDVLRSHPNTVSGYRWLIVFAAEHPNGHPRIVVDGSGLQGVGAGSSVSVVQVGGSHGRIHLPRIDGLALTGMAHDSSLDGVGVYGATVTVKGTLAFLNRALSVMEYIPDYSWSGDVKIYLSVNDHGFTGYGGAKTASSIVYVNVLPINTVPKIVAPAIYYNDTLGLTVDEDTRLHISGIRIYDSDTGPEGQLQVSLWAENGKLQVASGGFFAHVEIGDTALDTNLTLTSIVYQPNPHFSGIE